MRSARASGFTLIELMVAAVISAIVITGVYMVFMSETRLYHEQEGRRDAQANARTAFDFMSDVIRRGGYGIDPDRAFLAYDGFNATASEAAGGQPDYTVNYPDALTVQERDPMFRRKAVVDDGAHTITVDPTLTQKLYKGQILMLLCPGSSKYSYVTVASPADVGADTISYETTADAPAYEGPISKPGPWFHQDPADPCYASSELLKVDRYSFYVDEFNGTPYLMMNRGLDLVGTGGAIDEKDSTPLAAGVEQLQLAYVMNSFPATTWQPACGPDPDVLGVKPPTGSADPPQGMAWATAYTVPQAGAGKGPWWQALPYSDPQRCTDYPGNLRQIRITLVARGNEVQGLQGDNVFEKADGGVAVVGATLNDGAWAWRTMENLELNQPAGTPFDPAGGGYTRFVLRQSIVPPNLMTHTMFMPSTLGGG